MNFIEERIKRDGVVLADDVIRVDSFLNHQIDVALFQQIGAEFARRFDKIPITKILTVEASGIAVAVASSFYFNAVPVVFAKKQAAKNLREACYTADVFSYTKGVTTTIRIDKRFLSVDDHVLILDDFLANGNAAMGLIEIAEAAGATVGGVGVVIEKAYQDGRKRLEESGYRVEALARIIGMDEQKVVFADS